MPNKKKSFKKTISKKNKTKMKKDENCECSKLKSLREESKGEMADKDYDGDGEIESKHNEYKGSKDKAIKKAIGKKEDENSEDTIKESFNAFVKATLKRVFNLE